MGPSYDVKTDFRHNDTTAAWDPSIRFVANFPRGGQDCPVFGHPLSLDRRSVHQAGRK